MIAKKLKVARPAKAPDLTTYEGRFAARLRELRLKREPDVDRFLVILAQYGCDASKLAYYSWERGARVPGLRDFPALASALGISIKDLLPPH